MESINYASYRLGEVRTQEAIGTEARKRIERITSNSRTLTTSLMNTSECIGLYHSWHKFDGEETPIKQC